MKLKLLVALLMELSTGCATANAVLWAVDMSSQDPAVYEAPATPLEPKYSTVNEFCPLRPTFAPGSISTLHSVGRR